MPRYSVMITASAVVQLGGDLVDDRNLLLSRGLSMCSCTPPLASTRGARIAANTARSERSERPGATRSIHLGWWGALPARRRTSGLRRATVVSFPGDANGRPVTVQLPEQQGDPIAVTIQTRSVKVASCLPGETTELVVRGGTIIGPASAADRNVQELHRAGARRTEGLPCSTWGLRNGSTEIPLPCLPRSTPISDRAR